MTLLRCEVRNCRAITDSAQQGLLFGEPWRIERVGDELIIVCPAHNWRADGTLVAVAG